MVGYCSIINNLLVRCQGRSSVSFVQIQMAFQIKTECFSSPVEHFINTCTHYVFPEEWYPEKACQNCQGGSQPGKGLGESAALCAETGKGSNTHDAVWMAAKDVVFVRIQLGCLYQLSKKESPCS